MKKLPNPSLLSEIIIHREHIFERGKLRIYGICRNEVIFRFIYAACDAFYLVDEVWICIWHR